MKLKFVLAVFTYLILDVRTEELFCLKYLPITEIDKLLSSLEFKSFSFKVDVENEFIDVFSGEKLLLSLCPYTEDITLHSTFLPQDDSPSLDNLILEEILIQLTRELLLYTMSREEDSVLRLLRLLESYDKKEILSFFSHNKFIVGRAVLQITRDSFGQYVSILGLEEDTDFYWNYLND